MSATSVGKIGLDLVLNSKKFDKQLDGKKLTLDGVFGDNTEYALKSFEKAKGFESGVSGVCERAKWSALLGEYKK